MRWIARVWLLLWALGAGAVEVIERFDSDLEVRADGSMVVTETITVTAEGNQIRRGIYRDFPTDYRDRNNLRVRVDFEVLEATRDGRPENFRSEKIANGVRVYLGRAEYFLPPGRYRYQIRYRTDHQLGFFAEYDELYWNVTGNGWAFDILEAGATVRLPEPVPAAGMTLAAYTGLQGASGQDYRAAVVSPGVVRFDATRALRSYEGLTIAVGFPKGIVDEPGALDRLWRVLTDNKGLLVGLLGVIGVVWFYLNAWRAVGRDPAKGVIIPRYEAPEGYSPASLRYILRMKYDPTCMAAALVNLAVKGAVKIERTRKFLSKKFSVRKVPGAKVEFAPGEALVYRSLLGGRDEIEFDKDNHAPIQAALKAHKASLVRDYYKKYFVYNGDKLGIGVGLSVAAVLVMSWLGGMESVAGVAVIIALAIVNLLFVVWMKAPTMHGRKLMDHIEGLRLYLGVAERQDLERRQEPPQTFEEFEKLLPYAVALDCANTWVDRFESVLKGLEQSGELRGRGWYTGSGDISARGIARSVDGLSSSFASSISSSSTPPGSSSGSGGGGSSGGGGGGGGGGGW